MMTGFIAKPALLLLTAVPSRTVDTIDNGDASLKGADEPFKVKLTMMGPHPKLNGRLMTLLACNCITDSKIAQPSPVVTST